MKAIKRIAFFICFIPIAGLLSLFFIVSGLWWTITGKGLMYLVTRIEKWIDKKVKIETACEKCGHQNEAICNTCELL
jgi:hypothetical protein